MSEGKAPLQTLSFHFELPGEVDAQRRAAVEAVERLQRAGFTAFWAGGCVRDMLRGRPPKDYDIATLALPDQVVSLFPDSVEVGKSFGVVRVPLATHMFEVATFRMDWEYEDGRRPRHVTFSAPGTDAQRRDFTINALFYDPLTSTVYDHVGGKADLDARLVRCVGEPARRFAEDYLRMLRAVRFASTLDFRLDTSTATAIHTAAASASHISAERVREELTRILLEAARPGDALRLLDEVGLLDVLLPEITPMKKQQQPPQFHPEGDVFEHTVAMLNLMNARDAVLAWSVLLHDVGKPATARQAPDRIRFDGHDAEGGRIAQAILGRLRFSNDDIEAITHCVRSHMRFQDVQRMRQSTLRRLAGAPTFTTELELHRLDCLASHGGLENHEFLQRFARSFSDRPVLPRPWITGHDILRLGIPEGAEVGVWHRKAYEAQLEQRFPDRETLLRWIEREIAEATARRS
jgi:tRNA nucleotidyltransferase/poly(A) polymerase